MWSLLCGASLCYALASFLLHQPLATRLTIPHALFRQGVARGALVTALGLSNQALFDEEVEGAPGSHLPQHTTEGPDIAPHAAPQVLSGVEWVLPALFLFALCFLALSGVALCVCFVLHLYVQCMRFVSSANPSIEETNPLCRPTTSTTVV